MWEPEIMFQLKPPAHTSMKLGPVALGLKTVSDW